MKLENKTHPVTRVYVPSGTNTVLTSLEVKSMRSKVSKQAVAVSLCLSVIQMINILPFKAFAGGNAGGGNDVIIHADGQRESADPNGILVLSTPLTYEKAFSQELKDKFENVLVGVVLRGYDFAAVSEISVKISDLVKNPNIEYYLVDQLPNIPDCKRTVAYYGLRQADSVERYACTEGVRTYIVPEFFNSNLPLNHKAVILAHEGVRRLQYDDQSIFRFTSGLLLALNEFDSQYHGQFRVLSDVDLTRIKESLRAGLKMEKLSNFHHFKPVDKKIESLTVWPQGGGFVETESVTIPAGAVENIGIGTVIKNSSLGNKISIVGSLSSNTEIGDNVFAKQADLHGSKINENVTLENTNVCTMGCEIDNNTNVQNAKFHLLNTWQGEIKIAIIIGRNSIVSNSEFSINPASCAYCVTNRGYLKIGNNTSIQDLLNVKILNNPQEEDFIGSTKFLTEGAARVATIVSLVGIPVSWALSEPAVQFLDGTQIDGQGKNLCKDSSDIITRNPLKQTFVVRSLEDLQKYCEVK
jgi:hypothetical protein